MNNQFLIYFLSTVAGLLVIPSMLLAANKNKAMWYYGIVAQFIWLYIGIATHQYYLFVPVIIKQAINFWGLRKWGKKC